MTTFSPPLIEGPAPVGGRDHPLWHHYGNHFCGQSIWRDPQGIYHLVLTPYHGGAEYRTFNNGILISSTVDDPNTSLANATEVYLGGSVYDITDQQATDLTTAGFGDFLNLGPVVIDSWNQPECDKLSKFLMSSAPPNVSANPVPDSSKRASFVLSTAGSEGPQNLREFWLHRDIEGTDFAATTILDPLAYGEDLGGPGIDVLPQSGIALRVQDSGGIHTGITVNNNIFFVAQFLNIGVWRANSDGSGFSNRQFAMGLASIYSFPFAFDVELVGNIIRVRNYLPGYAPPAWDSGDIHVAIVNLDTDAGDPGPIPTPVGKGKAGLIVAHLGGSPLSMARFRKTILRRI